MTDLASNPFIFYLSNKKIFRTENLRTVGIVTDFISPYFKVSLRGNHYEIECWVKLGGHPLSVTDNGIRSSVLFFYNENLYLCDKAEDSKLIDRFLSKGKLSFTKEEWPEQLRQFVLPLTKEYHVEFDPELISQVKDGDPEKRVVCRKRVIILFFNPYFPTKDLKPNREVKMSL